MTPQTIKQGYVCCEHDYAAHMRSIRESYMDMYGIRQMCQQYDRTEPPEKHDSREVLDVLGGFEETDSLGSTVYEMIDSDAMHRFLMSIEQDADLATDVFRLLVRQDESSVIKASLEWLAQDIAGEL